MIDTTKRVEVMKTRLNPHVPSLLLASVLSIVGFTNEASANPGYTGGTGKPYNGTVIRCSNCHSGGTATVTIGGLPATMTAGQEAQVTVQVAGGTNATTFNAAFSAGTCTGGNNTEIPFPGVSPDEVTPRAAAGGPLPYVSGGGNVTYNFTFKAPNQNGTVTMYAVGVGTNNNGSTAGENIGFATRTTTVSGATSGGTSNGGTSNGGTSSGTSGVVTLPDGGKAPANPGSSNGGSNGGSSGDEDEDGNPRRSSSGDGGGCNTSPVSDGMSGIAGLLGAVGITYLLAKRRRR